MTAFERAARERLRRIAQVKIGRSEELLVLIREKYSEMNQAQAGLLVDLVTELEGCIAFNRGLLHLEDLP